MKLRCSEPNRGTMLGWLGAIMMLLGAANASRAADCVWTNAPAGPLDYNAATSWTNGVAPGASDAAVFTNAAVAQPNLSASLINRQVRFASAGASGYTLSANPGASLTLTSTGSGTTAGTGSALVGQHTSGTNTISAPIILGAAAGSTQNVSMATAGTLVFLGNISEQNSGIKLQLGVGVNTVRLSGNNSFTGGLTIDPGGSGTFVLELGSDTAIPSSGTFTILHSYGSPTIRTIGNTTRAIACPFAFNTGKTHTFDRDAALSSGATVFKAACTLVSNTTVLAGTGNAVIFEGSIGETGGSRNFTQNSGGGISSIQGYVFLMATNTWTGATTLTLAASENRGTTFTVAKYLANANTADSLGANTGANTTVAARGGNAGATIIRYIGGETSSGRAWNWGDINSSTALPMSFDASGSGALTLTGALNPLGTNTTKRTATLTFDGSSTADNTFASVIANPTALAGSSTAVAKSGLGTWVLNGANTFTGGMTVASGKLVLDYANNATVVNSANSLTLGGGTLELKARNSGASAQTLGNVTTASSTGLGTLTLNKNGGTGMALTTGTVVPNTTQSAALFDLGGATANSVTIATDLSTTPNNRILIKDGTSRYDWAKNTGASTAIASLTATTDLVANPAANTDYRLTGNLTMTGNTQLTRTLRIDPSANNQTLTLTQGTATSNTRIAALLYASAYDFTITQSAGQTGSLGNGTTTATTLNALIYQFGTGKLTLDTKLAGGNNSATGTGAVEFYGTGLIDWTRAAASSGLVLIDGVTLRQSGTNGQKLDATNSGLGSGNIQLTHGGVLEVSDNTTVSRNVGTGAGAIQWTGDGGFSAYGATRTVQLNGGTASIGWGSANFVPANNALVLGGKDSNAMIDFQNGLDFGFQQRVVRVMNGSAAVDARLSGVLSGNYGSGLIKDGAGTLELTAANSYLGETWVREGTLRVSGSTGSGAMTVYNGGSISGTGTVARLTLNSGGALKPYDTGGGVPSRLIVTGTLNITAGTLDLSGLETVAPGDHVIAECGSMVGSQFSNVIGLRSGRTIKYGATAITLKSGTSGTLVMIQ
jgi:autotransporter-associated beta strand protein